MIFLIAFVLAIIAFVVLVITVRRPNRRASMLSTVVLLSSVVVAHLCVPTTESEPYLKHRPVEVSADGYVGSNACRQCHPHNHATWHASYHRTMTQLATAETAVGDFDNVEITTPHDNATYRLWKKENGLYANFPNPGGIQDRPLVMSTGSHHMQIYWFPLGNSRLLGQLPIVYLKDDSRWVPRAATFLQPPEGAKTSIEPGRWNSTCVKCHATHGRVRTIEKGADTQVAEFGISCEACHGPGEQHIAIQSGGGGLSELSRDPMTRDPIVNPASLTHQRSTQVCGRCHGMHSLRDLSKVTTQEQHGFEFRPGDDLDESLFVYGMNDETRKYLSSLPSFKSRRMVDKFLSSVFWDDGMVRVTGREFNAVSASACYQKGTMSCVSCHKLHKDESDSRSLEVWKNDQLQPQMDGDAACLQCHSSGEFQTPDHTHHPISSTGSTCMNCHMPHTTYGLLGAIRNHQVDSPDVADSVRVGRPNACNLCHLDQTLDWSAQHLSDWYGLPQPKLNSNQQTVSAAALWSLSGDANQRVLIAWSMGWSPATKASGHFWKAPYLITLLDDPYAVVRYAAHKSLKRIPAFGDFKFDYVGSDEDRRAAVTEAWAIWNSLPQQTEHPRAEVLFDDSGHLLREKFDDLLKQRNNRPVNLSE